MLRARLIMPGPRVRGPMVRPVFNRRKPCWDPPHPTVGTTHNQAMTIRELPITMFAAPIAAAIARAILAPPTLDGSIGLA
jgi:hypothetical protein